MIDKNQHKDWLIGDRIIVTYKKESVGILRYIGTDNNDEKPMLRTLCGIPRNISLYLPNEEYENIDLKFRQLTRETRIGIQNEVIVSVIEPCTVNAKQRAWCSHSDYK